MGTAGAAVRRLSHSRRGATIQPGRAPHRLAPVRLRTPSLFLTDPLLSLLSGDFLPGAFADSALPQLHNGVVEAALGLHPLHRALRAARRRYPAPAFFTSLPPSFVPPWFQQASCAKQAQARAVPPSSTRTSAGCCPSDLTRIRPRSSRRGSRECSSSLCAFSLLQEAGAQMGVGVLCGGG